MLARLSALQFAHIAVMGASFPYLAVELKGRGVAGLVFTVAMVATPLIRLGVGPVWGLAADKLAGSPRVLIGATALSLLGLAGLAWLPADLVLWSMLVFAIGRVGIGPLVDARTMVALDGDPSRYGRVRMWGSAGFLVGAFAGGLLREFTSVSPLTLAAGLALLTVVLAGSLPTVARPASTPLLPGMAKLLRDPVIVWLLIASALHFAPHAMYDGYFAVHVEEGLDRGSAWAGTAIALGVGVETAVFAIGPALTKRFSSGQLLLSGILLALPRWVLTATLHDPVLVIGLQFLHGITFGLFWLAAVGVIGKRAPPTLINSGYGLLGAAVGGVGSGLANLVASRWIETSSTFGLFWVCFGMGLGATAAALLCIHHMRRDVTKA